MKFTCTQENLVEGLHVVGRGASRNIALPILNNVLLVAEKGAVRLQATNLEVAVTTRIRAKVETEGSYTVGSRLLTEYVSAIRQGKLEIETVEDGLRVTSEQAKSVLKGLPAEDFPVLPTVAPQFTLSIPVAVFRAALSEVIFAVANDDTRPEISGVLMASDANTLHLAATDSYRLSERRVQVTRQAEAAVKIIVPSRAAQEVLRILDQGADEIEIISDEKQALFRIGEIEIVTRLIEGQYPDYKQIIPSSFETSIVASKDECAAAIKAASLFAQPGINDLTVRVGDNGNIALSSASAQSGRHQAKLSAEVVGPEKEMTFNYRYLLEGIQHFPGDKIRIELGDPQAPGVIRQDGSQDAVYIIMPIRQ